MGILQFCRQNQKHPSVIGSTFSSNVHNVRVYLKPYNFTIDLLITKYQEIKMKIFNYGVCSNLRCVKPLMVSKCPKPSGETGLFFSIFYWSRINALMPRGQITKTDVFMGSNYQATHVAPHSHRMPHSIIERAKFWILIKLHWNPTLHPSNYTHYNEWDEITYPFLNFNGATVEVYEWISNFIPQFIMDLITYPCWD